jgi:hypothetical protein
MDREFGHIPLIDASIQIKKGVFDEYSLIEKMKLDTIHRSGPPYSIGF